MNNNPRPSELELTDHLCWLTELSVSIDRLGMSRTKAILENRSGIFPTELPTDKVAANLPAPPCAVIVESMGHEDFHFPTRIQGIYPLQVDATVNAATLLPKHLLPLTAYQALDDLTLLVAQLHTPEMKMFMNRVVMDPAIRVPFLQAPASRCYHHANDGGLLEHSAHAGRIAAASCDAAGRAGVEKDVIVVAALLHDLGKVRTTGESRAPDCEDHRRETLAVLKPHLEWLKAKDVTAEGGLRYVLETLAQIPKPGWPKFVGADIVIAADRISVSLARGHDLETFTLNQALGRPAPVVAPEIEI